MKSAMFHVVFFIATIFEGESLFCNICKIYIFLYVNLYLCIADDHTVRLTYKWLRSKETYQQYNI